MSLPRSVVGVWIPAACYLAILLILNPHVVSQFSTHFLFSGPDGLQNVWNLWWVNRSARDLTLPWFTTHLHYPYGTTLFGHTLNPFNGLLAIALLELFTLVQTYNLIVIFSFVMGGVTMFWLCREMTGAILGSLVGGALFTFSAFHVAHASNHLQLVALEWIPLFLLCWIRFCDAPTPGKGIGAAIVLFLVALCDFYYLAYCVIAGTIFYLFAARRRRDWRFLFRADTLPSTLAFVAPVLLTSGLLASALLRQHAASPFIGTHSPLDLAMDLLSPFVWSEFSRLGVVFTLWTSLSRFPLEASVYLGLSVIGLAGYALTRTTPPIKDRGFWLATAAFFGVMSLGPNLHVGGREISLGLRGEVFGRPDMNLLVLPYAVVWLIFPPWRLAGVPLRMMVMVQLVAALLAAGGLHALLGSAFRHKRLLVALVVAIVIVDVLPTPLGTIRAQVPAYVEELRRLPDGAVLDLASGAPEALLFQTVHEKPMVFGYVSRLQRSVYDRDQAIVRAILAGEWERLARDYGVSYVVKRGRAAELMVQHLNGEPLPDIDAAKRIFQDGDVAIYKF